MPKTVEQILQEWADQANRICKGIGSVQITDSQWKFIDAIRTAARNGVGYGWMQQVIEWEWNAKVPEGGWGPEYFRREIERLEKRIRELEQKPRKGSNDA